MIARPKMSQNEWKSTEIRASKVGNFSPFSCPGEHGSAVAVDCFEARRAYRAAYADLKRARAEREAEKHHGFKRKEEETVALDEDEARNDPVRADRDVSWQWRLPPREIAVSFVAGAPDLVDSRDRQPSQHSWGQA